MSQVLLPDDCLFISSVKNGPSTLPFSPERATLCDCTPGGPRARDVTLSGASARKSKLFPMARLSRAVMNRRKGSARTCDVARQLGASARHSIGPESSPRCSCCHCAGSFLGSSLQAGHGRERRLPKQTARKRRRARRPSREPHPKPLTRRNLESRRLPAFLFRAYQDNRRIASLEPYLGICFHEISLFKKA